MLLRRLGRLALNAAVTVATASAFLPSVLASDSEDTAVHSTFVSPDGNVAFAITVADDHQTDLYFTIRAKDDLSWAAVGLGSQDMPGALYLMVYKNERGDNVTFSPRIAYGHYEPEFYEDLNYQILNGTGIVDGYMYLRVKCIEHCRSWPARDSSGGRFDVTSPDQKAIFAYGPKEGYHSDKLDAPLKYHTNYGVFSIDVKRTRDSSPDDLEIDDQSTSNGTTLIMTDRAPPNWKTPLHGVVMIICVAVLFPIGILLLRYGVGAKWHALNQAVASVGVLLAFALGIVNSFLYQRSRKFNSSHQIIGFVVVGLLLIQLGLGVQHHTQYRKTQSPTIYGRVHRWVGRILLFFGVLNCFLGFTFALDRKYGMIVASLVIFITFGGLILLIGLSVLKKKKQRLAGAREGFNRAPEDWTQQPSSHRESYPSEPPPGYDAPSHQIGLRSMSPASPWRSSRKDDDGDLNLGSQQRPREFT
ncbi:hypothetical protein BGZ63DRAFT_423670 [Mariannaea sp. PMI_226]|nr:hypothetical protein BGZ63DRAFT_423670 [Mariannaea sp. PMI_226]